MSGKDTKEAIFVPPIAGQGRRAHATKEAEPQSQLESFYWQTMGWVHTPPFEAIELNRAILNVPCSTESSESSEFYLKKSFYPKIQVENRVPYGFLTKSIATDIEKRKYAQQDLKKILEGMGLENDIIRPPVLIKNDEFVIVKPEIEEGMPSEPFLKLELFDDDWFYESRSPAEWLAMGKSGDTVKPVPGTAFIPEDSNKANEPLLFEWQKVAVIDCLDEQGLYRVKNDRQGNCSRSDDKEEASDYWVPRIYLKFEAEDSLKFAQRLYCAVATRHIVEESLRLGFYVENMPKDQQLPKWTQEDVKTIIAVARKSRSLQPKLQWIKDQTDEVRSELQLEYKRAANFLAYADITGQNPKLIAAFGSEKLGNIQIPHKSGLKASECQIESFHTVLQTFARQTLWNQPEVVKALNLIQIQILELGSTSLYPSFSEELSLDRFEMLTKTELRKIKKYVHGQWITAIANSITSSLSSCNLGSYDLNQSVQHTFEMTKLGKLLKLIRFKLQDVIRTLVTKSLERYTRMFQESSINLRNVGEKFKWEESFGSNKWVPMHDPVFEVALEIKGTDLIFVVDLQKHRDVVLEFFDEGLQVTQGLPLLEKLVMKKLLYDPNDKLETVAKEENHILTWKASIESAMNKSIIVASAYARSYDETLKAFKEDQINYVKRLARSKTSCENLKEIIETHRIEKDRLSSLIPDVVDIGPLRLLTGAVRQTAIKKHNQLADAVLSHFWDRLRQKMEDINDQFLVLLDTIGQGTGNIEDLLEKKVWCRTVPKKIEKLSVEVNILRSDMKMIESFNRNMEDEDFVMYWRVLALPQTTARRLNERLKSFDKERDVHKQNLTVDLQQLKSDVENLSQDVSLLHTNSDLNEAATMATNIRRIRKELNNLSEKASLYNRREKLFGQKMTDYPEIEEMSEKLSPHELFWSNAAEFLKYKERIINEELEMEPSELREKIQGFRAGVEESLNHFTEEIHEAVVAILGLMDEFVESEWLAAREALEG